MARLFQLPRNKRFTFHPRYYDEKAEKRREREERINREVEAEKSGKPVRVTKEDMDNYIKMARKTRKKSNVRLLVILAVLFLIYYYFFFK